jgi:hypothetical protein
MPQSKISVDELKADNWVINTPAAGPGVILAEKKIENRNPLNASSDSDIKLVIHRLFNTHTFAILLPDGGMINFVANSMEELHTFERAINFYDPPF